MAYNYNKHKTIVTLSTTAISIASFVFGMLASSRVPGKVALEVLLNLILLKKPEYNHFQRCQNDALFNLDSQLPTEIAQITSAVAAGAIGASIYHGVNSLFAKKKLDSTPRQSQLEEFGFKKA